MSKVKKKKEDGGQVAELPPVLQARVHTAFAPYLKFWAALRTETDGLARINLSEREDEMQEALIVALEKIWLEWKGKSAKTVGTGTSKLKAGEFPFGDWVIDLCKARGLTPPSRTAIHKAIKVLT
jgi:hypothetical protein